MEISFQSKKGIGLDRLLPNSCPKELKDFLSKLLAYDAADRISSEDAIKHEYFQELTTKLETGFRGKDFRRTQQVK